MAETVACFSPHIGCETLHLMHEVTKDLSRVSLPEHEMRYPVNSVGASERRSGR